MAHGKDKKRLRGSGLLRGRQPGAAPEAHQGCDLDFLVGKSGVLLAT